MEINNPGMGFGEGCDENSQRSEKSINGINMTRESVCGIITYEFSYKNDGFLLHFY